MANFFNKVTAEINKGFSNVSENSKNIAEKVKLNMRLSDIEKQEKALCQQLGSLVYNLHISGDVHIEQCDGICADIAIYKKQCEEIKRSIAALEKNGADTSSGEIRQIVDGLKCRCGCMNRKTDLFCYNCGASLNADEYGTEDYNEES